MKLEHWTSDQSDTLLDPRTIHPELHPEKYETNARLCCVIEGQDADECLATYYKHLDEQAKE